VLAGDAFQSPILQPWRNMIGPSPSMCSLSRMPAPALAQTLARRLHTSKRVVAQIVTVQLNQVQATLLCSSYLPLAILRLASDELTEDYAFTRIQTTTSLISISPSPPCQLKFICAVSDGCKRFAGITSCTL
jgi:hypothetical protein